MSLTTTASSPLRFSFSRPRSTPPLPCSAAKPSRTWPARRRSASRARTSSVASSSSVSPCGRPSRACHEAAWPDGSRSPPRPSGGRRCRSKRVVAASSSSAAVSTSTLCTPSGRGSETLAQTTVTSAPRRAASAANARPIRPDERLPTKRTESIGSRVPPAVTSTRRPSRDRGVKPPSSAASIAASSSGRLREAADPPLPVRGQPPLAGVDDPGAAPAQRLQVLARRRMLVHVVVHGRGDHERRSAGERGAREQVVGESVRELGDRVRRRGSHAEHVAAANQLEVRDRVALRHGLPGEGAAGGVGLELVGQRGRPCDPFEGRSSHEPEARRRLNHTHRVTGAGGQAHQLHGLVRGDPAGDSEQDARHADAP